MRDGDIPHQASSPDVKDKASIASVEAGIFNLRKFKRVFARMGI